MQNKFKTENTVLPKDTKGKINDLEQIDNFALKLNKCVNWFKKDTFDTGIPVIENMTTFGDVKLDALKYKRLKDKDIEFRIDANFSKVNINTVLKTNRDNADALCSKVKIVNDLHSNWRLVVGLGNESVYETSMTLHHVYGIPYIPASGIKGVIRSWVINDKFDSKESKALKNSEFEKIFGSEDAEGKIVFFDAFPINLTNSSVQPDIMNPHYPDYYDGNKPPADWQSPKPIFFLTLKDTNFEFIFGIKEDTDECKNLLNILTESETGWLYKALKEQGIGAKTAVGYGRMFEKEKIKPTYWNKSLKTPMTVEAEIIGEKKVRLFISKDNTPEFSIKYCGESSIGTIVLIKIKNLKGGKGKETIDPNALEYISDKK